MNALPGRIRRGFRYLACALLVVAAARFVGVPTTPWQWLPLFVVVIAVTTCVVKDLSLSFSGKALVVGGVALRLVYMAKTPWWMRSYDIDGHFPYIEYIVKNLSLPPADWGWESFQPPLYYLSAAVVWKLGSMAGIDAPAIVLLRLLSIAYNVGFLVFGLKTQELLLKRGAARVLAAALLVFWPGLMIASSPISNDSLFFLFYAGALYCLVSAIAERRDSRMRTALVFAGLATATKFTGITLFPLILVAAAAGHFRDRRAIGKVALGCALAAAISVPVSVGNNAYTAWRKGHEMNIVGNIDLFDKRYPFRVGNRAGDYLKLDLRTYLELPWMNPWNDSTARRRYWNYLLKTSLFATFYFDPAFEVHLARAMSLLLLLLVCYAGAFFAVRRRFLLEPANVVLAAATAILVASSIAGRVSNPFCSLADFKYIMPVLIPATIFATGAMAALIQGHSMLSRGLGYLGYAAGTLFVLAAALFWSIMW